MGRLLNEGWDEKLRLSELERIRRLCRDDRVKNPSEVEESAARIIRFVEGRRKELQPELEGPAPAWPPLPSQTKETTAATKALMGIEGSFSGVITEAVATNLSSVLGHGSGTLQFTLNGKTRTPFTRFGVVVNTRQGSQDDSIVRMVATDTAGELRWNFDFRIDPFLAALRQFNEPKQFGAGLFQRRRHAASKPRVAMKSILPLEDLVRCVCMSDRSSSMQTVCFSKSVLMEQNACIL